MRCIHELGGTDLPDVEANRASLYPREAEHTLDEPKQVTLALLDPLDRLALGGGDCAVNLQLDQLCIPTNGVEGRPKLVTHDGQESTFRAIGFLGRHRVFLFTHYLGNRVLTLLTNVLYNTMLTDMETCYKVMRREVLDGLDLRSNGFGIEPEITAKIFKRHYRVYEVPISYDGRTYEEGKKISWRDGIVALWVLLKHRFGN